MDSPASESCKHCGAALPDTAKSGRCPACGKLLAAPRARGGLAEKLNLNKPGWRRARGATAASPAPPETGPVALLRAGGILLAALLVCGALFAMHRPGATPAPTPTHGGDANARQEQKQTRFLELYEEMLAQAGNDLEARYLIAAEARTLGLNTLSQNILLDILKRNPDRSLPVIQEHVLPELGFEFQVYHVYNRDKSNDYFQVWDRHEGWYRDTDLNTAREMELKYQNWLSEPATAMKMQARDEVAKSLGMHAEQFDVAFTGSHLLLMEQSPRYDSKLAFEQYALMLNVLYKDFLAFFSEAGDGIRLTRPDDAGPLVFVLFADETSYRERTGTPEYVAGHFDLSTKRLYTYKGISQKMEYQAIFHEGAHQLFDLYSTLRQWPPADVKAAVYPWVNEGLAECFAGVGRDGLDFVLRQVNKLRLQVIQKLLKQDKRGELTMQSIMSIDYATLQAGGEDANNTIYSGGWSIVHFLLHYDGGRYKPAFMRFLVGCLQGMGRPEHFRDAFEGFDLGEMNAQWREFVLSLE